MSQYEFDTPEKAYAEAGRLINKARWTRRKGRKGVEFLSLSGLGLARLPESIGQLRHVEMLSISHNQLTQLPESIGRLSKLKSLSLNDNKLTQLPESIGQLRQLQELFVEINQLTHLPESIGHLRRLQILEAHTNQLTQLPESLLALVETGEFYTLYLHGNEALGIPPEILGPEAREVHTPENYRPPEGQKLKAQDPKLIARYCRQFMHWARKPFEG